MAIRALTNVKCRIRSRESISPPVQDAFSLTVETRGGIYSRRRSRSAPFSTEGAASRCNYTVWSSCRRPSDTGTRFSGFELLSFVFEVVSFPSRFGVPTQWQRDPFARRQSVQFLRFVSNVRRDDDDDGGVRCGRGRRSGGGAEIAMKTTVARQHLNKIELSKTAVHDRLTVIDINNW